jgi:hypothetical protein
MRAENSAWTDWQTARGENDHQRQTERPCLMLTDFCPVGGRELSAIPQRCTLTLTLAMRAGQRVVGDARKRGELPSNVVFHLKLARRSSLSPNRSLYTRLHTSLCTTNSAMAQQPIVCMTASCQGLFAVQKHAGQTNKKSTRGIERRDRVAISAIIPRSCAQSQTRNNPLR